MPAGCSRLMVVSGAFVGDFNGPFRRVIETNSVVLVVLSLPSVLILRNEAGKRYAVDLSLPLAPGRSTDERASVGRRSRPNRFHG